MDTSAWIKGYRVAKGDQSMKRYLLAFVTVGFLAQISYGQTVIVDDRFESYANQTAFKAVWSPVAGNGNDPLPDPLDENDGYLIGCPSCSSVTDPLHYPGIEGQAVDHIGAFNSARTMVNQWDNDNDLLTNSFDIRPSATQNVFLSADIFVDSFGDRMTVGLRNRMPELNNLLELGAYNVSTCDPTHPLCSDPGGPGTPISEDPSYISPKGFAYRIILFQSFGGDLLVEPNWQYFDLPQELDRPDDADQIVSISDVGSGWHRFTATISETEVTVALDLFRDGFVDTRDGFGNIVPSSITGPDAQQTWQVATNLTAGFDSLRFGGPSGLPSPASGFTAFDNILLQLQPPIAPGVLGDFNEDDTVDAADYVVWRHNELANTALPNDGGLTTQALRYGLWRGHFGEARMPGSGSELAAAPEPATLALMLLSIAVLIFADHGRCSDCNPFSGPRLPTFSA
jgi:hypothetical protein